MDRETELLVLRARRLVCGVFAGKGVASEQVVRVGGSGILVGPFLAVTAKHVSQDLLKLDWRGEHPPTKGYFPTEHSSGLFQFLDPFGANGGLALWQAHRTSVTVLTDLSLMQVSPYKGVLREMEGQMPTGFFEWSLLPPPIGAQVLMLGYPKTDIIPFADLLNIESNFVPQVGHVSKVCDLRRERGMMNFPCFHIDKPVDDGFSGGPVFWGERLCGIVCSGSLEGGTYAATLWPLCLMEYEYPDLGSFGGKALFGELFESGVLQSRDWPILKHRISRRCDVDSKPYAHIEDSAT